MSSNFTDDCLSPSRVLLQFKVVSMRPYSLHSRLSEVSPTLPLKQHQRSSDSSFQQIFSNASFFHASLLQVVDDVMSLGLCLQVVS